MVPSSGARHRLGINLLASLMLTVTFVILILAPGAGAMTPPQDLPGALPPAGAGKISPVLLEKFKGNPSAKLRYFVTLVEQANVANDIRDWNAKGWYVLNTLRAVADRTQPPVKVFLDGQQRAGNVETYKSYYIVNGFSVRGNMASAQAL